MLAPAEIKDPTAQQLQINHMSQLKAVAAAIMEHKYPYPFYLSRVLDLEQKQMERADQRSLRFDRYNGQRYLVVTGNYYASYAAEQINANERVHKTLDDVVRPMLQDEVPKFVNDESFEGYAFEIAYHVRKRSTGVLSENAENVVFVFPRYAAQHIVRATNDEQLQAALLESNVFLNAQPFNLWVFGERLSDEEIQKRRDVALVDRKPKPEQTAAQSGSAFLPQPSASVAPELMKPAAMPQRIILPQTLSSLKLSYAGKIAGVEREVGPQAHFVSYAPPAFIGFHQAVFLQFSVETSLDAEIAGSRYKLAALAFDEHISHLIRPTLAYFQESNDFDGFVFSTTIQRPGKSNSQAVEFFLPFTAIKCYAQYDCTGQQLIDAGFVMINGERVTLNLIIAESANKVAGE
ncbi:MAG: hypothetical protein ACXVZV_05220 [Terriglobales bacterium]